MTRRGEPLPINQAMNRSRAKLGLELPTWMAIAFVSIVVFLAGFRFTAILTFPTLVLGAWLTVRTHPKMFQIWGLSLGQKAYYDPRKD
ncbi:VirB3 family type IV secretion system protein [Granulicella tundricola]|uniref:Transporter, type IV (Conjugal DNA-protein transfer or VirB) secretory pathway (IVSP) family n=1 Tax=Granulicella tundricola (strain ATCC BAA-1859 / DSM 23138 / MP5ACTX9) TaxID=1198114 RepID=E8X7F5_GRATM|nr:VirB3 family type IV secretion system protein [Granulicella tundricola]ADW71389.1 transporter, type IV (conjugal DNA-protein transfer or VirB) secretory pathway (IVSP) family [Granulicella tundricola MP5ACTX9]